jgi:RNA polymerase sigma-70 factor (ECF subfamily)
MIFKKNAVREEFKTLTYPHMKLLYNMALKYCGNTHDAQDIVQETYLMAFSKFHQLRDKSKCKPWLLRILRNNFLKSFQKNKIRQKIAETDYVDFLRESLVSGSAETLLVKASGDKTVQDAINLLPVKYKEVLLLYYMEDMLYKEIAATLDVPIGTVMSRLTRAKGALKTALLKMIKTNNDSNILNIDFKTKTPALTK